MTGTKEMIGPKATLSSIIGLGSVLCFIYRLNYQLQGKLPPSLKPGIKPRTGILKIAASAGNKATPV